MMYFCCLRIPPESAVLFLVFSFFFSLMHFLILLLNSLNWFLSPFAVFLPSSMSFLISSSPSLIFSFLLFCDLGTYPVVLRRLRPHQDCVLLRLQQQVFLQLAPSLQLRRLCPHSNGVMLWHPQQVFHQLASTLQVRRLHPVRGPDSVKSSPPGPCGSAQVLG